MRKLKRSLPARTLVVGTTGLVLILSLVFFALFIYYAGQLPRPENFGEVSLAQSTRIYDRTGEVLLFEVYGEVKREVYPMEEFPEHLKEAIISAEDSNFYKHFGIDPAGIVRAVFVNLKSGSLRAGGSTISQQLVRNSLLTRNKSIERKMREVFLTLEMERKYSKNQILELFLNQIPFGSNAYGVGAASNLYFHKRPSELTLSESALLAAMMPAPSYYSPFGSHQDDLLERKDYVIRRMRDEGYITTEQMEASQAEEIVFAEAGQNIRAPHFSLQVLDELLLEYGDQYLRENGLRVITTLDWELQEAAEKSIADMAEQNKALGAYNAALAAIDPQTGEILAEVGSRDWFSDPEPEGCDPGTDCLFDPKLNVATSLPGRQPGSAFKPFVYATAFKKGFDDNTVVVDEETNFGVWGDKEYIPKNFDGMFRGPVTLRQALAQSLNVPSVKVLVDFAGIQDSIDTARAMGITTLKDASNYGPSLVLGGGEVRLLDMASAYGVFAAQGRRVPPFDILRVESSEGRVLKETRRTPIVVLDPKVADMITSILKDNASRVPVFAQNSSLNIPGVAAKTGTTQEFKDAWVMGYTDNIAVGVWVGNSSAEPADENPSVILGGPIWNRFMRAALELRPLTPS